MVVVLVRCKHLLLRQYNLCFLHQQVDEKRIEPEPRDARKMVKDWSGDKASEELEKKGRYPGY